MTEISPPHAAPKHAASGAAPKRPRELEDRLNFHIYHPLAWRLAKVLSHTPVTPNLVSVFGALLVVAAGIAYAQPGGLVYPWSAALGMVLHMSWHVVDGADGDLARLTGKASPVGEMVDGICDYGSHIVLYFILAFLLQGQIGWIAWPIMVVAGVSHIVQSNHIEVQRRSYQWWYYDKPWLKTTHEAEGAATRKRGLGGLAAAYLAVASGVTPITATLDAEKERRKGDESATRKLRQAIAAQIPPLATIWRYLGPNPRAIVLGLAMFAGSPLWFFIYQAVVLNLLLVVSVRAHNRAWSAVASDLEGEAKAG
jgi:phosphatidylglycerophosphate synthase